MTMFISHSHHIYTYKYGFESRGKIHRHQAGSQGHFGSRYHMENYRLPVTIRYLLQIWRKFRKIEFKPLARLKWLLSYWLCPFLRSPLPLSKLLSVWNNADAWISMDFATIGGSFHYCPPYFSSCFWVMPLAHYLWCIWWLGALFPG